MDNRNYLRRLNNKKTRFYAIIAVVLIVLVVVLVKYNPFHSGSSSVAGVSKVAIADAKSTVQLNREFKFPLKDDKGETVGEIKYNILSAELRDEIVIKGRKATAVDGRVFLVLNLKIVNDSNKNISMNTKDYVRLTINGNDSELLAPSIHNDPVVIDAISTQPTRVGFAIGENDKDIKLKVGEIKGDKTTIDIKF